jgi:hypothetical protein
MGLVGLSDAFLYMKRFTELSNGQQYRAMLAQLVASGCNIWLADEFCANLDEVTANLVADRLQKTSRQMGATLIVASSHPELFAAALCPDQVVHLTTTWEHRIIPGTDFLNGLRRSSLRFQAPRLTVSAKSLREILSGKRTTITHIGRIGIKEGLLLLRSKGSVEAVSVTDVRTLRVGELMASDADDERLKSVASFKSKLRRMNPLLSTKTWLTKISCSPLWHLKRKNVGRMA